MTDLANDLNPGFQILWYKIHSVLGRGGFGITYLAEDTNLNQLVAIKEYLPQDYASRSNDSTVQPISIDHDDVYAWGLERFMSEAQTLAKFKHDNIVRVTSVFKDNNTGYMVMDYEQGRDLSDIYEEKKHLTQAELEEIYLPIMDGLKAVHAEGFIHRDIKPSNIYIRDNGSPVLLDFGAARHAVGSKTRTLTAMLSVGYAPFEQYNENSGKQGPWTDIYALGASLYQGVTGDKPVESTMRGMALLHNEPDPYYPLSFDSREEYTQQFLRAIDASLMLQINDRPQSLDNFMAMLKGKVTLTRLQPNRYIKQQPAKTVLRSRSKEAELEEGKHIDQDLGNRPPLHLVEEPKVQDVALNSKKSFNKIAVASIILVVTVSIGLFLFLSGPSPEEIKRQKVGQLLIEAEALVENRQYISSSGDSALSIFNEVLSIEPENSVAIEGLNNMASYFLKNANKAIELKKYSDATKQLDLVESVNPEFPGLREVEKRLLLSLKKEKSINQISRYLSLASSALKNKHVYQPMDSSALSYFNKALELDSNNSVAKKGLNSVAQAILSDAKSALRKNDSKKVLSLLNLAEQIDPSAPDINKIRQQANAKTNLSNLIARADSAYARQRYTTPKSENAVDLYSEVIKISPNNVHANGMLNKIADFYANRVRSDIRKERFDSARSNLDVLTSKLPNYPDNKALKKELSGAREKKELLTRIQPFLPTGINQNQSDEAVLKDIVESFINAFKDKKLAKIKNVANLNSQSEVFFNQIFDLYNSLNLDLIASSSRSGSANSNAEIKLQVVQLVDRNGNQVESTATWTKIQLELKKKNGFWYRADLGNW